VNSGTSKLGAYKFIINYNENVINVDTSKGDYQGADTGADGFVSAFNAVVPGKIVVNGFSAMGTGPGEDLHVLTIYWTTVGTGTTTLDLTVEQLADEVRDNIGTPNGLDGARTVE
jgi:hypothetical protein